MTASSHDIPEKHVETHRRLRNDGATYHAWNLLYPWLFNSLPWYRWPIEIDGLPIKNDDFPWLC